MASLLLLVSLLLANVPLAACDLADVVVPHGFPNAFGVSPVASITTVSVPAAAGLPAAFGVPTVASIPPPQLLASHFFWHTCCFWEPCWRPFHC